MSQQDYEAESPTLEDEFWIKVLQQRAINSAQFMEDTAKQYITITSFSQTVYFAAISFSEVKKSLSLLSPVIRFIAVCLLISPLICWIFTLITAARTFPYKLYQTNLQSSRAAEEFYQEMLKEKSKLIRRSLASLILGFILLIINIIFYLQYYPKIEEDPIFVRASTNVTIIQKFQPFNTVSKRGNTI